MGYILGVILILGLIFSVTAGTDLVSGFWDKTKAGINDFIFPKTEREITIDNLGDQYSELNRFFSSTAPTLLNSNFVSSGDKEAIKKASEIFKQSQNTVEQIKKLEKNDKSLIKMAVEKILDLDSSPDPDPTHIPPGCNLVCGN